MSKHKLPTYLEVRERIEAIGRDYEVSEIKQLPKNSDSEKYRMVFKYQLLVAGRIAEVCGQYAPKGIEVFEESFRVPKHPELSDLLKTDFRVETIEVPAAMFVVKTAKREGKLRAAALPLDPKYEPWTRPLLEYFQDVGDDYPFMFNKNPKHSIRYAQWVAAFAFDGLEWNMKKYSKSELRPIENFEILAERINDRNKEVCLIELDEDTAKWVPKVGDTLRVPVGIPGRWKPFRSHALRKRRELTNKFFYKMDIFQRAAFGGWTETSQVDTTSGAMEHYDYLDLSEFEESYDILIDLANLYFPKLLRPFSDHR